MYGLRLHVDVAILRELFSKVVRALTLDGHAIVACQAPDCHRIAVWRADILRDSRMVRRSVPGIAGQVVHSNQRDDEVVWRFACEHHFSWLSDESGQNSRLHILQHAEVLKVVLDFLGIEYDGEVKRRPETREQFYADAVEAMTLLSSITSSYSFTHYTLRSDQDIGRINFDSGVTVGDVMRIASTFRQVNAWTGNRDEQPPARQANINEMRQTMGLPALTMPDGSADPRGEMTLAEVAALPQNFLPVQVIEPRQSCSCEWRNEYISLPRWATGQRPGSRPVLSIDLNCPMHGHHGRQT